MTLSFSHATATYWMPRASPPARIQTIALLILQYLHLTHICVAVQGVEKQKRRRRPQPPGKRAAARAAAAAAAAQAAADTDADGNLEPEPPAASYLDASLESIVDAPEPVEAANKAPDLELPPLLSDLARDEEQFEMAVRTAQLLVRTGRADEGAGLCTALADAYHGRWADACAPCPVY